MGTSSVPRIMIRSKAKQYLSKTGCVLSRFNVVWLCATLWMGALQVPLFMGFSRQESWRVVPFLLSGDLPDPGVEPAPLKSPALASGFFTNSTTWEVHLSKIGNGKNNNKEMVRTSLVVLWSRLHLPVHGVWVQPLVRKLRSPVSLSQKSRTFRNEAILQQIQSRLKNGSHKKRKIFLKKEKNGRWQTMVFMETTMI